MFWFTALAQTLSLSETVWGEPTLVYLQSSPCDYCSACGHCAQPVCLARLLNIFVFVATVTCASWFCHVRAFLTLSQALIQMPLIEALGSAALADYQFASVMLLS